jgi:hypothetical protein
VISSILLLALLIVVSSILHAQRMRSAKMHAKLDAALSAAHEVEAMVADREPGGRTPILH